MTKTEELRDKIERAIVNERLMPGYSIRATREILSICKESGLKFVETIIDDSTCYNEPDTATRTQIEEIE